MLVALGAHARSRGVCDRENYDGEEAANPCGPGAGSSDRVRAPVCHPDLPPGARGAGPHCPVSTAGNGDLEQRIIRAFAKDRTTDQFWWFADMEILLLYLMDDGLLQDTGQARNVGGLVQKLNKLTKRGQEYVAQWPTD